jgi:hypothetical protein
MTRNKLTLLAASLAVAMGLFWANILTSPPVTLAAPSHQSLDIDAMHRAAPGDLPSFDDVYQRHTGVLDVLKTP